MKIADLKFYRCPLSTITRTSWELLQLVNDTTNGDGDVLHLPYPGGWLDQPERYREAVRIVKSERARHRKDEIDKIRSR